MPQPTFNIIFATSSDFTLPILQSILDNQGKTLLSVALEQLNDLEKNLEIKPSPNFENNLLHNYLENIKAKLLEYQNNKHLENLHKPIKVVAVITQPDRENRGKIILNPISTFAVSRNLELFTPLRLNLEQEKLARFSPDIVIVASFGQIISTKILAIPTHGFINWHQIGRAHV